MKINLRIQDPSNDATLYGIDAIVDAAVGAKNGRAVFAFATVAGVDLLLNHDSIRALTKTGFFEVIVGIDAITNRQTLERLRDAALERPGLHAKVFWNSTSGLFHPKFCHFWNAKRETWIVSSGNLTPRGLRDSYEACVVIEGKRSEVAALSTTFDRFLGRHAADIREIDDEALKRASKNTFTKPVREIEPPESHPIKKHSGKATDGSRVLVAELPKGGARWQQANFDRATAREFFGIEPDKPAFHKELFLNELDNTGTGVREEVRRFTFTRSKNLRVQLAAKNGIAYPKHGRPIAVFREVKSRHFVYQLLLPGEDGFSILKTLLDKYESGDVRRHITVIGKLRKAWSQCPLG